jgi:hypothetical protein
MQLYTCTVWYCDSLMALISRVGLHDHVTLNCSVFCEVFLKLRKFYQSYENLVKNPYNFVWPIR